MRRGKSGNERSLNQPHVERHEYPRERLFDRKEPGRDHWLSGDSCIAPAYAAARETRGWTRSELARRAHMNAATVGGIENGRLVPYDVQIAKLARALGVRGVDAGGLLDEVDSLGEAACPRKQAR